MRNKIFFLFFFLLYNYVYSNTYKIKLRSFAPYEWDKNAEIQIINSLEKEISIKLFISNHSTSNPEEDLLIYNNTITPSQKLVFKKFEDKKKFVIKNIDNIYLIIEDEIPFVAKYSSEAAFSNYKYTFKLCEKPTYDTIKKVNNYIYDDEHFLSINISDEEAYIPRVDYVYCEYAGNKILKGIVYNTYKLNNIDDVNDISYTKKAVYRPYYTQDQKDIVFDELRKIYFEYKEYKKHYEEFINTKLVNSSSYKYSNTPQISIFSREHTVGQQYIADITYYDISKIDQDHYYLYNQLSNCIIEYSGDPRFDFTTYYRLLTYEGTVTTTMTNGITMELPFYTCSSENIEINSREKENIKNKGDRWDLLSTNLRYEDFIKQLTSE
ncbi:MAG: hypothetical protein K5829_10125 [Treponema sp.]|nr:hypothetical protein [Treponema sp.]